MSVTLDRDLRFIVEQGKAAGYLTYDQVSNYLPDEDVSSDKINDLLQAIEENKIPLIEVPQQEFEQPAEEAEADAGEAEEPVILPFEIQRKPGDDPIRMYLAQMSGIPLLNRDEEILLAKKIELAQALSSQPVELRFCHAGHRRNAETCLCRRASL